MPDTATPVFLKQLKYWSLHCSINALPSFIMAGLYLNLWQRPGSVAAMLAAIGTFVLLYATITSLPGPFRDADSPFSRALKLGTRIRIGISALSLCLIPMELILLNPDFWCGWLAMGIVNAAGQHLLGIGEFMTVEKNTAASIYLTTLLEGFLLSTILMMISFFALIFGQMRRRKKFGEAAGCSPGA